MIADRVKRIMGEVFGIDPQDIPDDASPNSIAAWDSLKHMSLIMAIEEDFGFTFSDDEINDLISLKLITLTISAKTQQPAS